MTQVPGCILCQASDFRLLYPSTLTTSESDAADRFRCTSSSYGVHDDIFRCRQCGLVCTAPSYSNRQLVEQYTAIVDPLYVAEREGRVLTFRRNLQPIKRLLGPGRWRLLDVGCNIGVFVELAQAEGWETWGVEPSAWAAEYARQRGLQVIPTTVAEAGFADAFFDIVTLWDVIEHLADPVGELREIHRILRPGGLLVVHTINIESPLARLMGARWPWLMEMHRFYYAPRTLGLLLRQTGFTQFQTKRQGRYLRLGYLLTRLTPYLPRFSNLLGWAADTLHLVSLPVPVNLGDLFTSFAWRNPNEIEEAAP